MLVLTAVIALICAGIAAPQSLCVSQQCDYPDQCENRPNGVSVCVKSPAPTCDGVTCPGGQQCILQQSSCTGLPCNPQPTCVTSSPCGLCIPPNEFCELQPYPTCRLVVEPNCSNKLCPAGQTCREEPLTCSRAPCGTQLICEQPNHGWRTCPGHPGRGRGNFQPTPARPG